MDCYSKDLPSDMKLLSRSYVYAANAINVFGGEHEQYYGLKEPAGMVDLKPRGPAGGRVMSLGSMGFVLMLGLKGNMGEALFMNFVGLLLTDESE